MDLLDVTLDLINCDKFNDRFLIRWVTSTLPEMVEGKCVPGTNYRRKLPFGSRQFSMQRKERQEEEDGSQEKENDDEKQSG